MCANASVSRMAAFCSWPMFAPALFFHICRIVEHILGSQGYLETDHHRTSHLGCPENEDPPRPQKLAKKTPKSKIFILFTFYANQTYFHKKVLLQEVTRKWPMRMYAYFLKDRSRPQRPRSFWSAARRHGIWVKHRESAIQRLCYKLNNALCNILW